jgi:glycosyltransferase involved in cell wall biosynthesis
MCAVSFERPAAPRGRLPVFELLPNTVSLYKHHYPNAKPVKPKIKIIFDATPMVVNKTGIAYYTERIVTQLAAQYPDDVELVGFYYNFLGRRDASHLPVLPNLRYTGASFIPSKIVFELRRWGIEIPIELLALQRGDFILYANFLSHPSLFRTPSAPVIHDLTYRDLPELVSPKLRRDLVRFVPKAIKRSAFVVTVSKFSKRGIHKAYNVLSGDILVTPIPPPPKQIFSGAKNTRLLREANIHKPFVLFVGTIEPRKNIIGLINAYTQLPKKLRETYSLVLAGRIERFAQAEEAAIKDAQSAGYDVIHLGYVTDETKDCLFQSATIFAHASRYEGFGMPILEAMNYGRPCAISDIPVFKEVGNDAALYFDYKKPAEVTHALEQLLSSAALRTRFSKKAAEQAASFKWEKVAADLYDMIRSKVKR